MNYTHYFKAEVLPNIKDKLSFLLILLCHPCLDFVFRIARRFLRAGLSIMHPDKDYLHNRIHFQYRKFFKFKNIANSGAGLTVTATSTGFAQNIMAGSPAVLVEIRKCHES